MFTYYKHLGVNPDSKLSFSAHINAAISEARRGIGWLRLLSRYFPRSSLCEVYILHIRPHLDYGDVLYHIPTKVCEFRSSNTLPSIMEKLNRSNVQLLSQLRVHGRGHRGRDYTMSSVGNHSILENGLDG